LSRAESPVSSAPYAKADCAQQNPEIRFEAVQDYRDGKSQAATRIAKTPPFVKEREAQTAHGEIGRSP
jgi:hypothetical protein